MGLENYFRKKLSMTKEQREKEARFNRELKEKKDVAFHLAKEKAAIARAKEEGKKAGSKPQMSKMQKFGSAIEGMGKFGAGMSQGLNTWGEGVTDELSLVSKPRNRRVVHRKRTHRELYEPDFDWP